MSVAEVIQPDTDLRHPPVDSHYEIVNGEIVELPPMSFHANKIASRLVRKVGSHADANGLGEVVAETLFRLPLTEDRHRNRRPDVAFVSYERWPRGTPESYRDIAWDVVPDLAVEVVSPDDFADELMQKVGEYFEAGVRQVWAVYPRQHLVFVYDSLLAIRGFRAGAILEGGVILPGLSLPLGEVFVEEPTDKSPPESTPPE